MLLNAHIDARGHAHRAVAPARRLRGANQRGVGGHNAPVQGLRSGCTRGCAQGCEQSQTPRSCRHGADAVSAERCAWPAACGGCVRACVLAVGVGPCTSSGRSPSSAASAACWRVNGAQAMVAQAGATGNFAASINSGPAAVASVQQQTMWSGLTVPFGTVFAPGAWLQFDNGQQIATAAAVLSPQAWALLALGLVMVGLGRPRRARSQCGLTGGASRGLRQSLARAACMAWGLQPPSSPCCPGVWTAGPRATDGERSAAHLQSGAM